MLVLNRREHDEVLLDLREWGLGVAKVCVTKIVPPNPTQNFYSVKLGFDFDNRINICRREVAWQQEWAKEALCTNTDEKIPTKS